MIAADERRHRSTGERWWSESWRFDAVDQTGLGLFVQFTIIPNQRSCWFVAGVARPNQEVVLCHDTDASAPAGSVIEIRSGALWSHAICETPGEHWTVAMEAYALELSDPTDAWSSNPIGTRVGLAFDLEWERLGEARLLTETHYELDASLSGELQVDDDRWEITGSGMWSHRWNDRGDGWADELQCAGHAADMVRVCWLSPGPGGNKRAERHLTAHRWCSGTGGSERTFQP